MRRLTCNVYLDGRFYAAGTVEGDVVEPERIGDHCWSAPAPAEPATDEGGGDAEPEGSAVVDAPPRSGPGSGKSAWAAFALAHGVDVHADASRDDIITAVEAAGINVE